MSISMNNNEFKYCPICQLPLQAINIAPTTHVNQCLSSEYVKVEECPEGINCLNTNVFHYRDYCHSKLAQHRSSSDFLEPLMDILPSPRKRLKLSPVTVSSKTEEVKFGSDSDSDDILPRKHTFLKFDNSQSSISNYNNRKKNKRTTQVSNVKRVKNKQPCVTNIDKQKSFDSDDCKLQSSESPIDKKFPTETEDILNRSFDLFEDNDTFPIVETESVPTSSKLCDTSANDNTYTSSSDLSNYQKNPVTHNFDNSTTSILNDLFSTSSEFQVKLTSPVLPSENNTHCKSSNDKEKWKALFQRTKNSKAPSHLKVHSEESLTTNNPVKFELGTKHCPFYKRIPGTSFVVDAFQYGDIPGVKIYFLSHFHSDHYIGLRKKFSNPIYCSEITANLVKMKIGVDKKWLNVLELNKPQVICGVEVTALDANHCPGSLMLLFQLKNGSNYLHVGDFRASSRMCSLPELRHISISKLFLDTTYCSPRYRFPTQEEIISRVVSIVRNFVLTQPRLLVACGSYLIGKEKVFLGIAEALDWKIWARPDKRKIYECLNDPRINCRLVKNGGDANIHVLPMNYINHQCLLEHMVQFNSFKHILGIKPTGWELNSKSDDFKVDSCGSSTVYGVPYSEHSSYTELQNFVQFIHPDEIIPTVNVGNPESRKKMNKYFEEWLRPGSKGKNQSTVSSYFSPTKSKV